jgi:hypothetical protein
MVGAGYVGCMALQASADAISPNLQEVDLVGRGIGGCVQQDLQDGRPTCVSSPFRPTFTPSNSMIAGVAGWKPEWYTRSHHKSLPKILSKCGQAFPSWACPHSSLVQHDCPHTAWLPPAAWRYLPFATRGGFDLHFLHPVKGVHHPIEVVIGLDRKPRMHAAFLPGSLLLWGPAAAMCSRMQTTSHGSRHYSHKQSKFNAPHSKALNLGQAMQRWQHVKGCRLPRAKSQPVGLTVAAARLLAACNFESSLPSILTGYAKRL